MKRSGKEFLIIIIVLLFLFSLRGEAFAQGSGEARIKITILDYKASISGIGRIKFVIDEVFSNTLAKTSLYKGKIVTLTIRGMKRTDISLFDEAQITLGKNGRKTVAKDLEITEKYHKRIELPLNLKTDIYCDKKIYFRNEKVKMTLLAKNTGRKPIVLPLSSAKQYDFIVRNSSGRIEWQWSNGKMFITMLQSMIFALREEKKFEVTWDKKDNFGKPVSPGVYTVEGNIATSPPYPAGRGRIRIRIK